MFGEGKSIQMISPIPIGSARKVKRDGFYTRAPKLKYVQDYVNTCCFGSLEQAVVSQLKSYLLCEYFGYKDRIRFASNITRDNMRNKGDNCCGYKLHQWGEGCFDILMISVTMLHWFN